MSQERSKVHISGRKVWLGTVIGVGLGSYLASQGAQPPSPAVRRPAPAPITDAVAAYVTCPPHTRAAFFDMVQPQDGTPASITFTCDESRVRPRHVGTIDVTPSTAPTPSPAQLKLPRTVKFVFEVADLPEYVAPGPDISSDKGQGTPYSFVEIGGISGIQGPIPQPSPGSQAP